MKPLTAKQLIKLLESKGFQQVRQRGSHLIFENEQGLSVSVPVHGKSKPIFIGTLLNIFRQAGLK